jgi:hypothetical protein
MRQGGDGAARPWRAAAIASAGKPAPLPISVCADRQ